MKLIIDSNDEEEIKKAGGSIFLKIRGYANHDKRIVVIYTGELRILLVDAIIKREMNR